MSAEPATMPDGSPMHRPCTCQECSPGPGIDFKGEHEREMTKWLATNKAEREARVRELRRKHYGQ